MPKACGGESDGRRPSLTKVLRSANNNDILNMRKGDNADSLHLVFEGTSTYRR